VVNRETPYRDRLQSPCVRNDSFWSYCSLTLEPNFQQEAAQYKQFWLHAKDVVGQYEALGEALIAADQKYVRADTVLDSLIDAVEREVKTACDNNRSHPLYQLFFGTFTPSELKRPCLGVELETMRSFPSHLAAAPQKALQDLAPIVAAGIAQADAATKEFTGATDAMREFRVTGAGKKLADEYNALRSDVAGKLSTFVHSHAELLSLRRQRPPEQRGCGR
jgi:hypothetical protein